MGRLLILNTLISWLIAGPTADAAPQDRGQANTNESIRAAVRRAVDDKSSWDALRLEAECETTNGYRRVVLFGSGVAIWNGERQFAVDDKRLRLALGALDRRGFADMNETYGGTRASPKPRVLRQTCRVALEIGDLRKEVRQLDRGEQSAALKRLAGEIVRDSAGATSKGVSAATLADGLQKIVAGVLAPEVLEVHANVIANVGKGAGRTFSLDGTRLEFETSADDEAEDETASARVARHDIIALAKRLVDQRAADLPLNVYGDDYLDLSIRVLNREKSIQLRRFAGRSPKMDKGARARLKDILDALQALQKRAAR